MPSIHEHCTGCGRCVAACRFGALSLATEQPNGFGRKRAVVMAERCVCCQECLPACPHQTLIF
jgi:ferredoxin